VINSLVVLLLPCDMYLASDGAPHKQEWLAWHDMYFFPVCEQPTLSIAGAIENFTVAPNIQVDVMILNHA